jgi:hypothetical protein
VRGCLFAVRFLRCILLPRAWKDAACVLSCTFIWCISFLVSPNTFEQYGQTGAGKTHTLGNARAGSIGIIPRAAAEIFSAVESDSNNRYDITLSYLQIYCEQIQDLLRPENGENLTVREDSGGGVHVPALTSVQVSSLQDCLKLQQLGERNRTVAFTQLNAHSSRSHAVLILTVVKRRADSSGQGNEDATDPQQATTTSHSSIISPKARRVQIGKLYLVDLAGSERLKKSGSTGIRASEAKHINLSLTTLGMCVNARATGNAAHVPFRDSKLTRQVQVDGRFALPEAKVVCAPATASRTFFPDVASQRSIYITHRV